MGGPQPPPRLPGPYAYGGKAACTRSIFTGPGEKALNIQLDCEDNTRRNATATYSSEQSTELFRKFNICLKTIPIKTKIGNRDCHSHETKKMQFFWPTLVKSSA